MARASRRCSAGSTPWTATTAGTGSRRRSKAILAGEGVKADTPDTAIAAAYARDETDEFITPSVIGDYDGAKDGDGLFFANFRADRAREILNAMIVPDFDGYETGPRPKFAAVLGMVEYSDALNAHMDVMFPSQDIANTLGAWVSSKGLRQMRIAETEKYPHVTFFLNGGVEDPAPGEERHMAPSPKVRTYDLKPEMSEDEVTAHLVAAIGSGDYDLIVVNYANPDMVGHTGVVEAGIAAVEAVDEGLGQVLAALDAVGRRDDRHCRSRQLRDDDRPRDRRPAHGPYAQPRPGHPRRRAERSRAARWTAL